MGYLQRKVGDSNPRYACAYTAFRVRLFRPLRQLSVIFLCKGTTKNAYMQEIHKFLVDLYVFSCFILHLIAFSRMYFVEQSQCTRDSLHLLNRGIAFASGLSLTIFICH